MEKAPIWAYRRALEIISQDPSVGAQFVSKKPPEYYLNQKETGEWPSVHAFARYISEKEEPPVDPDEVFVANILGQWRGYVVPLERLKKSFSSAFNRALKVYKERNGT